MPVQVKICIICGEAPAETTEGECGDCHRKFMGTDEVPFSPRLRILKKKESKTGAGG